MFKNILCNGSKQKMKNLTKLMYTFGCPVGPLPPSHQTTLSLHAFGATSAIKLIAKFGLTCFGLSINLANL